jgi:hypothetical protein
MAVNSEDLAQVADLLKQLRELGDDLVLLEAGQSVQAQVEDRLGLDLGQAVGAVVQSEFVRDAVGTGRRIAGARQHGGHRARAPGPRQQGGPRLRRRRRGLDQRDDLVDVGERDCKALEQVRALARLAQVMDRPAGHDLAAVTQECVQDFLERQQLRLAVEQGDHVDAEHRFHRRQLEELVQHQLAVLAALELDHDAQAVLVGLVAQLRDPFDLLGAHEVGDALQEPRLVDLVRQLGDDDGLAAAVLDGLDRRARPHGKAPAPRLVSSDDLRSAVDDAGGRKVRARDEAHEVGEPELRVVD